jgi:hypothetical protein
MNDHGEGEEGEITQIVNKTISEVLQGLERVLTTLLTVKSECNESHNETKQTSAQLKLVDYNFYHDHLPQSVVSNSNDVRGLCPRETNCRVDCHMLILPLFNQKTEYISLLSQNLDTTGLLTFHGNETGITTNLSSTIGFGAKPVWTAAQSLDEASRSLNIINITNQADIPFRNFEVQGGGGSGMGFQLYCVHEDEDNDENVETDNQQQELLLTTGYGGGGGFYWNTSSKVISFGGGGGGGIQLRSSNISDVSMLSVGGGSGCGISDSHGSLISEYSLYCGSDTDEDNSDTVSFREAICSLSNREQRRCNSYVVYGGGGGGGGSDLCCGSYHFGYGFSFTLSTTLPQQSQTSSLNRHRYLVSDDSDTYRLKYNLVGSLMNVIITTGRCQEGYRDWSCLCQNAKSFIQFCMQSNNKTIDMNVSNIKMENPLGADFNLTSQYCSIINSETDSLGWIISSPCDFNQNNSLRPNNSSEKDNQMKYFYAGKSGAHSINNNNTSQDISFSLFLKGNVETNASARDFQQFFEHGNGIAIGDRGERTEYVPTIICNYSPFHDNSTSADITWPTVSPTSMFILSSSKSSSSSHDNPMIVFVFSVCFIIVVVIFAAYRIQQLVLYRNRLRLGLDSSAYELVRSNEDLESSRTSTSLNISRPGHQTYGSV